MQIIYCDIHKISLPHLNTNIVNIQPKKLDLTYLLLSAELLGLCKSNERMSFDYQSPDPLLV